MNKKERVLAAIRHEPVDYVPAGFFQHYPLNVTYGHEMVEAHLHYLREIDSDIFKIMNENLVPKLSSFQGASGYEKALSPINMHSDFIVHQIDLTKEIVDRLDTPVFTLGTIHGTVASALHALKNVYTTYDEGRNLLTALFRENPDAMLSAADRITDAMCALAQKLIGMGMDGIFYAALGGETRFFSDEEYI